ncbi:unnamed protein product, partial [Mycena citricolor]
RAVTDMIFPESKTSENAVSNQGHVGQEHTPFCTNWADLNSFARVELIESTWAPMTTCRFGRDMNSDARSRRSIATQSSTHPCREGSRSSCHG